MASHGLKTLLKVPFSRFWEHHFQLPKRYPFRAFENIASSCKKGTFLCLSWGCWEPKKKVPLLRFKTSFGKVRNGWRADNTDVKISFTRKLKIPAWLLFPKRYLFSTFNLNDRHRQKRKQFCILFYGKWMQKLSFSGVFN